MFTLAVTCQVDIAGSRVTVYSGSVQISGGQTLTVTGADGSPALLPAGAHCYAEETDTGGADATSIDHDSYDTAAVVEIGDELQTVTITATNTFNPNPPTRHRPAPPPPTAAEHRVPAGRLAAADSRAAGRRHPAAPGRAPAACIPGTVRAPTDRRGCRSGAATARPSETRRSKCRVDAERTVTRSG